MTRRKLQKWIWVAYCCSPEAANNLQTKMAITMLSASQIASRLIIFGSWGFQAAAE
jgi:hypothetical protein